MKYATFIADNCLKFSAVFGTVLPKRPIRILPADSPPIVMSNVTISVAFGPFGFVSSAAGDCAIHSCMFLLKI
ncbi:hypothetical protein DERF_014429 [Dermatophagoides farinae]|uniref:Uncharacterized protein n=1 Tax=Dermatophagoides farinae TaxID=6954 RepID=A0A922L1A1_DERFA|nr:hypothetical protein DERF_014429 [Dermatophagoides farinae]